MLRTGISVSFVEGEDRAIGAKAQAEPAPTGKLRLELERALSEFFRAPRRIVEFERRPNPYRTSFALEELGVTLDDGLRLELLFKNVGAEALSAGARRVKPEFLREPRREIEAYRRILAGGGLDTPTCYGTVVDEDAGRFWLFLEKVAGDPLWEVGEFELWQAAARWLAGMHERLSSVDVADAVPLIRYDRDYYRLWLSRAQAFAGARGSLREQKGLQLVASCYDHVVERLAKLPTSVIHGEFYAANILLQRRAGLPRICVVDWEMAALGPSLIDLAALSAGKWGPEERQALAGAYYEAVDDDRSLQSRQAFLTDLEYCRLHLAVQWLGWAEAWSPPPWQQQDWLAEAVRLVEELDP